MEIKQTEAAAHEDTLCAVTIFGLEGVCADELRRAGFSGVRAEDGRVYFSGGYAEAFRANLWLRTAERVLIVAASFQAKTFDALFDGVAAAPLERWIDKTGAFPVKGHSIRSALHSIPDCQRIIKKAAAMRLGKAYGVTRMPETGTAYQLSFQLIKDQCTLYIDTSGEGLHKRGYRAEAGVAPIRETLAAGMVYLTKRRGDRPLCDPFCGSGTLLIEAALHAGNRAPGMRRTFAVERFAGFPAAEAVRLRREAESAVHRFDGALSGSDIDPDAVRLAGENAKKAGLNDMLRLTVADVRQAVLPETGLVLTNPPYGERLGEIQNARALYHALGERMENTALGAYIITSDITFEKEFGRAADKKRKLYNGMIPCVLYQYHPSGKTNSVR